MGDRFLFFGISVVIMSALSPSEGFSQAQAAQNRIAQQVVINGQMASGAYVTAGGQIQSYTCPMPQRYTTADGSSQGWACYEQTTGVWLLNALPPAQTEAPAPVPVPAPTPQPVPQQPPVIYQQPPFVVFPKPQPTVIYQPAPSRDLSTTDDGYLPATRSHGGVRTPAAGRCRTDLSVIGHTRKRRHRRGRPNRVGSDPEFASPGRLLL